MIYKKIDVNKVSHKILTIPILIPKSCHSYSQAL